jgi:adenosylcobinamide kinase/adenosylcobinamide-phosphate guanylyltransferase
MLREPDVTGSLVAPHEWTTALLIGGSRSGKSALAEKLVTASGRPRIYIATAEAWDDEMRQRIDEHRASRGDGWQTIDAPQDLPAVLSAIPPATAVLVDCLTLWLSNRMLADADPATDTAALLAALDACPAPVALVTNEVGQGIVPENALARRFRDAQGRLNQAVAARADLVVGVMAGLPFALKGTLPDAIR